MDSMVARASSGDTSGAMRASPTTLMRSRLPGRADRFEIGPAVIAEPQFERLPRKRLSDLLRHGSRAGCGWRSG